jgi:predicted alternative tryptophan synthase beta-subunit
MAFLATIGKWILTFFIEKVLTIIVDAIKEYMKVQEEKARIKKEVKEKIDEIKKDPDPVSRAKRLRDYLSTSA